ncbi:MAG: hypothetical protein E7460_09505 [Ruminococcaceae bacterium]|nr:hypothetical protein [Oscillospiraceae bacterium]
MRETRQKIKRLSKGIMFGNFFKLAVLLGLQYVTTALLVRVFGLLGTQLRPDSVIRAFGLEINTVGLSASILSAFLSAPLELGIARYIMGLIRKEEVHFGDVFGWYGDFAKLARSIPFGFYSVICAVFQVALFDIPLSYIQSQLNIVLEDIEKQLVSDSETVIANYGLMDGRGILISLGAMLLVALIATLFVAVPYVYADTGRIFRSVFSSPRIMFRYVWSYMLFVLSFSGFYIATVFTLGLMGVYLLPYFGVSKVMFVEFARRRALPGENGGEEQ